MLYNLVSYHNLISHVQKITNLKRGQPVPPEFANKFLNWILKEELVEEVLGDLEEKFDKTLKQQTSFIAKANYWYQTLNYLRPFAMKSPIVDQLKTTIMLRNYFKIAFRNLAK